MTQNRHRKPTPRYPYNKYNDLTVKVRTLPRLRSRVRIPSPAPIPSSPRVKVADLQSFLCLASRSVNQTVIQSRSYLIGGSGIFYYSHRIPATIRKRVNKDLVILSLRTRSQAKALQSLNTFLDRLETYWENLRLELFLIRKLDLNTMAVSARSQSRPHSV